MYLFDVLVLYIVIFFFFSFVFVKKKLNLGKEIFKFKGEIMKWYLKCIYWLVFLIILDSCFWMILYGKLFLYI